MDILLSNFAAVVSCVILISNPLSNMLRGGGIRSEESVWLHLKKQQFLIVGFIYTPRLMFYNIKFLQKPWSLTHGPLKKDIVKKLTFDNLQIVLSSLYGENTTKFFAKCSCIIIVAYYFVVFLQIKDLEIFLSVTKQKNYYIFFLFFKMLPSFIHIPN